MDNHTPEERKLQEEALRTLKMRMDEVKSARERYELYIVYLYSILGSYRKVAKFINQIGDISFQNVAIIVNKHRKEVKRI